MNYAQWDSHTVEDNRHHLCMVVTFENWFFWRKNERLQNVLLPSENQPTDFVACWRIKVTRMIKKPKQVQEKRKEEKTRRWRHSNPFFVFSQVKAIFIALFSLLFIFEWLRNVSKNVRKTRWQSWWNWQPKPIKNENKHVRIKSILNWLPSQHLISIKFGIFTCESLSFRSISSRRSLLDW